MGNARIDFWNFLPGSETGKQMTEKSMRDRLLQDVVKPSSVDPTTGVRTPSQLTVDGMRALDDAQLILEGKLSPEQSEAITNLDTDGTWGDVVGRIAGRGRLQNDEVYDTLVQQEVTSGLTADQLRFAQQNNLLFKNVNGTPVRRRLDKVKQDVTTIQNRQLAAQKAGLDPSELGIDVNDKGGLYAFIAKNEKTGKGLSNVQYNELLEKVGNDKALLKRAVSELGPVEGANLARSVRAKQTSYNEAVGKLDRAQAERIADSEGVAGPAEKEKDRATAKALDLYKAQEGERRFKQEQALANARYAAELKQTAMQNDANMERYRAELEYDRQKRDEDRRIALLTKGYGAVADLFGSIFMFV